MENTIDAIILRGKYSQEAQMQERSGPFSELPSWGWVEWG